MSNQDQLKRKRSDDGGEGAAGVVLNEAEFDRIRDDLRRYDEQRERIIKTSRDVQKRSKQAIFSLHRKDFAGAKKQLDSAEETALSLVDLVKAEPTLRGGSFSNALEEYAEAKLFQHYLQEGALLSMKDSLGHLVKNEEYLGGVLDFCGELNRFAVQRATARDEEKVKECRDLVENIMAQYLKFDFRNSGLRRKYDGLKYTLKNLETMLYELSLTHQGIKKTNVRKEDVAPKNSKAQEEDD